MATKSDDERALATLPEYRAPAVPGMWSEEEQKLIRAVAGEAITTPRELALFAKVCNHTGLDPFMRQIYAVRYQGKLTFQTGIDGYRLIAQRTGKYGGTSAPEWYDAELEEWKDVWLASEPPAAARVSVYRTDFAQPTVGMAMFNEYAQYTGKGNERRLNTQWSQRPAHMLAKCAEALALRRAFPNELSGLYTGEETGSWVDVQTGEIQVPENVPQVTSGEASDEADDPAPSHEAAKSEPAAPRPSSTAPGRYGQPPRTVAQIMATLETRADAAGLAWPADFVGLLPEGGTLELMFEAYARAHATEPIVDSLIEAALARAGWVL